MKEIKLIGKVCNEKEMLLEKISEENLILAGKMKMITEKNTELEIELANCIENIQKRIPRKCKKTQV